MGVSKVDFNGKTLVDLTGDTVTESNLLQGATAHNAAGEQVEGAVVVPTKTSELENDAGYAKKTEVVTGVKGNNETDYRTGDVNITPENVGALPTKGGGKIIREDDISVIELFSNYKALGAREIAGFLLGANEVELVRIQSEIQNNAVAFWAQERKTGKDIFKFSLKEHVINDNGTTKNILLDGDDISDCMVNGKELSEAIAEASTSLTNNLLATVPGVSALDAAVGPVIENRFGGCSFEQDGEDFYIVGADSVRKKLGSDGKRIESISFKQSFSVTHTASGTGTSKFTITYTITFSYENDILTGFSVSSSGWGTKGSYYATNGGTSGNEIIQ